MELKDISSESTVVFGFQSVPFDKEFEKGGVKQTCKVVKVGIGVMLNPNKDGFEEVIDFTDYWPISQNELWTSFKTKDGSEFDLHIGDKEIFGDLAKKSGFFAEIFGLDAENHIDTCEWVFPKEVLVA
jgi:hypothetical protein